MKNFLELRDTRIDLPVRLSLRAIIDNGVPDVKVIVNGADVYTASLKGTSHLVKYVDPLAPLSVEISMTGKNYSAVRETAIVIDRMRIGDVELVPNYTQYFTYRNDQNHTAPTNYLGFNGTLTFAVNEPFYHWAHRITGQGWLLAPD